MRGQFFTPVDPILLYIVMNDLYTETVTRNGKIYHYDPDRDIYYCRHGGDDHWTAWAWVFVVVVLGAVCYYVEYLR